MNGLADQAVAAAPKIDLAGWRAGFDDAFARMAGRFAQACSRRRARAYLLGLLSRTEQKIGRTIAELAGDGPRQCTSQLDLVIGSGRIGPIRENSRMTTADNLRIDFSLWASAGT